MNLKGASSLKGGLNLIGVVIPIEASNPKLISGMIFVEGQKTNWSRAISQGLDLKGQLCQSELILIRKGGVKMPTPTLTMTPGLPPCPWEMSDHLVMTQTFLWRVVEERSIVTRDQASIQEEGMSAQGLIITRRAGQLMIGTEKGMMIDVTGMGIEDQERLTTMINPGIVEDTKDSQAVPMVGVMMGGA